MKYIVEMNYKHRDIDILLLDTDSLDEAVEKLTDEWNHLTYRERKDLDYLMIKESINPDVNADDHYDGLILIDMTEKYRVVSISVDDFYGESDADYIEECQCHGIPADDLVHMLREYGADILNEIEEI